MTSRRLVVSAILLTGMVTPLAAAANQTPRIAAYARNVTEFGAVCDGVRDDRAAIQAGLNAIRRGGQLVFPRGRTCSIRGPLRLNGGRNWTIIGQNARIQMHGSVSGIGNNWLLSTHTNRNFAIYDLTLDGNWPHRRMPTPGGRQWGAHNLAIWSGTDFKLVRVRLYNAAMDGLLLAANNPNPTQRWRASRRGLLHDVVARNNWRLGMLINNAEYITVENSVFTGSEQDWPKGGVDIEANAGSYPIASRFITFRNNLFYDNVGYGIQIDRKGGSRNITIIGNYFANNARGALGVNAPAVTIRNNLFEDSHRLVRGSGWRDTKGIVDFLGGAAGNTLSGNSFREIWAGRALLYVPHHSGRGHVYVNNCIGTGNVPELYDPLRKVRQVNNQFRPGACPDPR
jgi:hypothetical protein